ncbi:cell division protein FtsX [Hydrotalea sandarakina]|uniref:Cell division protein FtsX n=1 Tax=Hydrotalea sandarakina TaxID=1004304 RepID=A0A2W7RKY8_9BACT|nr:cell division protein FtsX [Hydrotalea sandarakina]
MQAWNNILKKIIKTASGRIRLILAIMGLSVALLLILSAVQLQANYHDLLHSKSNQDSIANFLVVNKQLTNANYGNTTLSATAIDDLKKQPFVDAVGILTPSRFKASIESFSSQFPFYTDISFESVPAAFIDVDSTQWQWQPGNDIVPMIAPNLFLDFYNFQFSLSQNLPQLTQEIVKMIIFKVNIQTPNGVVSLKGKVVGFSDRITSLLVPESFMQWANNNYGTLNNAQPSRVVIRTKDPGNPALVQYLKDHQLTTDADKTRFSKYRQIVNVVVQISGVTGGILLLFALLIFSLFIQLTIASCKEEIQLLVTLGAAPKQLRKFLMHRFFPPNVLIIIGTLIIVAIIQYLVALRLQKLYMFINPMLSIYTFATALLFLLILWVVNYTTIQRYIQKENL